jgi:hypothetical protein
MRIAGLLLGVALSLAATGRAGDQDAGVSQVAPSKDDPPVETSSPKVKDARNPDQPPARGPNPAKVEVIVFLDYENPNSARMRRAIRQLPNEFPGEAGTEVGDPGLRPSAVGSGGRRAWPPTGRQVLADQRLPAGIRTASMG